MKRILLLLSAALMAVPVRADILPFGAGSISDTINPAGYGCVVDFGNWIHSAGVVQPGIGGCDPDGDRNGVPYTLLGYKNGPGYRGSSRTDPCLDPFAGLGGVVPNGPAHPAYLQEAAVPMGSETHAGEDVAIYAIGPAPEPVRGTVKNTHIFFTMKRALGF